MKGSREATHFLKWLIFNDFLATNFFQELVTEPKARVSFVSKQNLVIFVYAPTSAYGFLPTVELALGIYLIQRLNEKAFLLVGNRRNARFISIYKAAARLPTFQNG